MRYFVINEQELVDVLSSAKQYQFPIVTIGVSGSGYIVETAGDFPPDEHYAMKLRNADTMEYLSPIAAQERGQ